MCALVRVDLYANAEALQAQVEIRTHGALDADGVADVFIAIVAMKEGPAIRKAIKWITESFPTALTALKSAQSGKELEGSSKTHPHLAALSAPLRAFPMLLRRLLVLCT